MYELYFSTNGRIPRSTFWTKFVLVFSIIYLIGIGVDISNDSFDQESKIGPFSGLLIILSFYPGIAGTIKRAHDRNRSGWFILLSIIPFVNIWVTIELNFLKGTSGDNDYGVDPLSNFDLTKDSKKQGNDQSNPNNPTPSEVIKQSIIFTGSPKWGSILLCFLLAQSSPGC